MLELSLAVGLLELDLWSVRVLQSGWLRASIYLLLAALFCFSWRRRNAKKPAAAPMGRAWLMTLAVTCGLAVAVAVAGWLVREPYEGCWRGLLRRRPGELRTWLGIKAMVVLGQQIGLLGLLWPLCRDLMGRRGLGLLLACALFGVLHLPSLALVAITGTAALAWVVVYQHTGRLLPLVASHLLLAVLAHGLLPERLVYNMRVGAQAADLRKDRQLAYRSDTRARLRVLASDAYYAGHGGTDEAFVGALYRDVLHRPPADWEKAEALENLRRLSRAEVAEALVVSCESQEGWRPSYSTTAPGNRHHRARAAR